MADPAISGGVRDSPGRLPRPRTSFVGRESELAQAAYLLGHNRLLTLTGPGGCGKTRLSIALAARVMGAFPEGVRFVPLARVLDDLVALAPRVVVPAHCTGWRAQHAMGARFGEAFIPNTVGTRFEL